MGVTPAAAKLAAFLDKLADAAGGDDPEATRRKTHAKREQLIEALEVVKRGVDTEQTRERLRILNPDAGIGPGSFAAMGRLQIGEQITDQTLAALRRFGTGESGESMSKALRAAADEWNPDRDGPEPDWTPDTDWVSSSDLVDRFGLTPRQLREMARRGRLHPRKSGKLLWYKLAEVKAVYPSETRE